MTISVNLNSYTVNADGSKNSSYPAGDKPAGITSVSGTIADGQTLTVSGFEFGANGPSNYMFEDFSAGTNGADVTTSNSNFDTTSQYYPATFTTDSRSGSLAAQMNNNKNISPNDMAASVNSVDLTSTTEVFKSFAVKVPSGAYFPGTNGGNSGTNADYPSDSSWKMDWLLGPDAVTNDLITLSHIGGGIWATGGNDLGTLRNYGTDPTWWKWANWNRITQYVKAGATPQTDAGVMYTQIANGQEAITEFNDNPVVFANGQSPYHFTQWNINGWIRPDAGGSDGAGTGVSTLYDDIYVAWGDYAAARVELGDASTYESCTNLAVCEVSSWSNTSISTVCRSGGLNLSANTWLFVTLPNNTTRYSYQVVTV